MAKKAGGLLKSWRLCALSCALPLCLLVMECSLAQGIISSSHAKEHTLTLPLNGAQASTQTGNTTGSVQFIGTATVLIRFAGLTILTDPNFLHKGGHVPLGYGLTAERLTDPAIDIDNLPPIDLIVLSHMHGDHFDQLVQQKMDKNIPIVTTPEASRLLNDMGFKTRYALDTWDTLVVHKGPAVLSITAMPGHHGPGITTRLLPQVMGSMLELSAGNAGYRIYISGDTLVYDDIYDIPKRYPDIDLALLHLGGTRLLGVLKVTMDGRDGVKMLQIIAPHHAVPIHYDDYDVFKSPLSDFQKRVKAAGLNGIVTYLQHGDIYWFQAKPN